MSGYASATSSGSMRETSQITKLGGSTLSVVVQAVLREQPFELSRKNTSTPASRIVATRQGYFPPPLGSRP